LNQSGCGCSVASAAALLEAVEAGLDTISALDTVLRANECGTDGSLDERGTDGAGSCGLNAWGALILAFDGDTLAGAVLLDGVELLGGVAGSVVVVVLVVDVVHVVVVDVGALQGLVALKVALSAPQNLGLSLGVDSDSLAHAVGVELVATWGV